MEPNPQQSEYTESTSPEVAAAQARAVKEAQEYKVDVNVDQAGAIAQLPPASPTTDQALQEWVQPVFDFLAKLPALISGFYYEYQQGLIIFGLVIAGFVTVYVTLAVLDAINDIPLLQPIFELVGIGYTIWFVARYLWKAETRKELGQELNSLKGQLLGKDSLNS
ncbi:MAG TPA: hypothetical protein DD379_18755 [Cyanobacteria bacterium UBA11162]|nr:hypothetical protein [Cyanobacteria bacterium UBA12227]HAX88896.1 hypothetical protein [Cyanobacteria bacterium UBA11370]HBL13397.1 hypothetical protein [Cyanobacteria bacterium UBA11162]HBY76753.1 hypothetical protein [Cyanobacteria bacterium UBA11148]